MECPEVALWRAVVQQAVSDAQIPETPLPEYPLPEDQYELELLRKKDGSVEVKLIDTHLRVAQHRDRIKEERRFRDEARAWLNSAGPDFRLVCSMADIDPEYASRKFSEAA